MVLFRALRVSCVNCSLGTRPSSVSSSFASARFFDMDSLVGKKKKGKRKKEKKKKSFCFLPEVSGMPKLKRTPREGEAEDDSWDEVENDLKSNSEREKGTDKPTDRPTDRHTDTQTYRETDARRSSNPRARKHLCWNLLQMKSLTNQHPWQEHSVIWAQAQRRLLSFLLSCRPSKPFLGSKP